MSNEEGPDAAGTAAAAVDTPQVMQMRKLLRQLSFQPAEIAAIISAGYVLLSLHGLYKCSDDCKAFVASLQQQMAAAVLRYVPSSALYFHFHSEQQNSARAHELELAKVSATASATSGASTPAHQQAAAAAAVKPAAAKPAAANPAVAPPTSLSHRGMKDHAGGNGRDDAAAHTKAKRVERAAHAAKEARRSSKPGKAAAAAKKGSSAHSASEGKRQLTVEVDTLAARIAAGAAGKPAVEASKAANAAEKIPRVVRSYVDEHFRQGTLKVMAGEGIDIEWASVTTSTTADPVLHISFRSEDDKDGDESDDVEVLTATVNVAISFLTQEGRRELERLKTVAREAMGAAPDAIVLIGRNVSGALCCDRPSLAPNTLYPSPLTINIPPFSTSSL